MLKKIYRLSSIRLTNSKKVTSPLFGIRFSENNLGLIRFGIVISKRIDKRATERNSLKRKFYSSLEEIFDRIRVGNDIVFYPTGRSLNAERNEVMEEIQKTLSKERLLND